MRSLLLLLSTMILSGWVTSANVTVEDPVVCLTLGIDRNGFKQEYKLLFTKTGVEGITDQDAIKIGEGYVSIAGLVNDTRLAIDQRPVPDGIKEIKLDVKGWTTGNYTLLIKDRGTFDKLTDILLIDRYANKCERIDPGQKTYNFHIDLNDPDSQGAERFSLFFEQKENPQDLKSNLAEVIYPNPFSDKLHIKTFHDKHSHAIVIIRNSLGAIVFKQSINLQESDPTIPVQET